MRLLVVAALVLAAPVPLAACEDDEGDELSPAVATIMSVGATRAAAMPPIDPYSTPTPLPPTRVIVLDSAPRWPEATPAELGGTPFVFGPWDRKSAVVYDLATGETITLEPSVDENAYYYQPSFDDASTQVAWVWPNRMGLE